MSDEIDRAVATALGALDTAPDGWLELAERRRLREAFGPWTPPYAGGPDAGLLRRASLLVACVHRALPVWEQAFPDDRRPRELVERVMPALRGDLPEAEVYAVARPLREDVDRLGGHLEGSGGPFFAGLAAVFLASEAWDGDLDPELYPPETRDLDMDELRVDALAAYALAGEDPEARRAFWRWYVTEAFPAAYAVTA